MISQTEIQDNKSGQLFVDSQCSTIKCDVSYTVYYLHQVRKFSASSLLRVFVCFLNRVCSVTQLCPALCVPMECKHTVDSGLGSSPGKNTRLGCYALLQGIFLMQE